MPILKVSKDIKKYALEVLRVPISILGNCPQCQSNAYREGICPDCFFIEPRVQEAIQEWQEAMGIQQVVKQQQEGLAQQNPNAKAAYQSLAFTDILPSFIAKSYNSTKNKNVCPRCESELENQLCPNAACGGVTPEGLGFKNPVGTGIDSNEVEVRRKELPRPFDLKVTKVKSKIKNKEGAKGIDPGALQDDSMNASMDATTRMWNLMKQDAEIKSQEKMQTDDSESKEQP
jgi:hypothetical protein